LWARTSLGNSGPVAHPSASAFAHNRNNRLSLMRAAEVNSGTGTKASRVAVRPARTMYFSNSLPRSRGAFAPELLSVVALRKNGGRRECRVRAAPAVSCAFCAKEMRTRAYRFSGSSPASPAQWLYGLCRALPGDEFVLPPSSADFGASIPIRSDEKSLRGLGTSNGCQDHAVLPYASGAGRLLRAASRSRVSPPCDSPHAPDAIASTATPAPRFQTIAIRPSLGPGCADSNH
jgi:hypothetical protein